MLEIFATAVGGFLKRQAWIIIMEVADMIQRDFVKPTEQEIQERRTMYAKAEELGIDLLKFDDNDKEDDIKRDIRKAIIFLGEGKEVPSDLRERLIQRKEKDRNSSNG